MRPFISVIIPIYNSEKYLDKCIESIRDQSLKNIEIILINDGSSDDSLRILRQYEKIDERVIVIDQKNSGPSSARNKGIDIAKGEYISFIDSDDWVDETMFEEMYDSAKENNSDVVICDMKLVNKNEEIYITGLNYPIRNLSERAMKEIIFRELLSNSQFNSMANKIFRTSIIEENNIRLDKDIYYAEDWLFNVEFFRRSKKISYINKAFYYYRRGHESSSSSYNDDTFEKVGLWIYRMRKEYANEFGLDDRLASDDLYNVLIHCIINEFKRSDISFIEKLSKVDNLISRSEVVEVVYKINRNELSVKYRYLLYCIKYKLKLMLFIYVIFGEMKFRYKNQIN